MITYPKLNLCISMQLKNCQYSSGLFHVNRTVLLAVIFIRQSLNSMGLEFRLAILFAHMSNANNNKFLYHS